MPDRSAESPVLVNSLRSDQNSRRPDAEPRLGLLVSEHASASWLAMANDSALGILKLMNSWNLRLLESWNPGILESWNPRILET